MLAMSVTVRGIEIARRPAYWTTISGWSAGPLLASLAAGAIAGTVISILMNRHPVAGALVGAVAALILCMIAAGILVDAGGLH